MFKRALDLTVAGIAFTLFLPFQLVLMALIWSQDGRSPFYLGQRVGRGGKPFKMVKYRSMVVQAPKAGVFSTAADDRRITPIGHFVRRYKLDELGQFWNVLIGEMSLVGPRPQVPEEVDRYTEVEHKINSVRPGITDFASIVFSDEGDILKGAPDPDLMYNQLIRPWKSRLALFYIEKQSVWLDLKLLFATALAIVSRPSALERVVQILTDLGASSDLIEVSKRRAQLTPFPPPGSDSVFEWPSKSEYAETKSTAGSVAGHSIRSDLPQAASHTKSVGENHV